MKLLIMCFFYHSNYKIGSTDILRSSLLFNSKASKNFKFGLELLQEKGFELNRLSIS